MRLFYSMCVMLSYVYTYIYFYKIYIRIYIIFFCVRIYISKRDFRVSLYLYASLRVLFFYNDFPFVTTGASHNLANVFSIMRKIYFSLIFRVSAYPFSSAYVKI